MSTEFSMSGTAFNIRRANEYALDKMQDTYDRAPSKGLLRDFWAEGWDMLEFGFGEDSAAIALDVRTNFGKYVAFEDGDLLIMKKPAGIISHASLPEMSVGLTEIARECRPDDDIHNVNRLDIPTSGAIILAKHEKALIHLTGQFLRRDKNLQKIYATMLDGVFPGDETVETTGYLSPSKESKVRIVASDDPEGKIAISYFTPLTLYQTDEGKYKTLAAVRIKTGRTHQIRVSAASMLGMPVTGDRKYNPERGSGATRMMLHSQRIDFLHPRTGQPHSVSVHPPEDFMENFAGLHVVRDYQS